jgi:hypothetical protein
VVASYLRSPAGELLLEYFTDEEALGWRGKSEDVHSYHYLWWFELEGQRAAHQPKLIEALRSVAGITVDLSVGDKPCNTALVRLSDIGIDIASLQ